MKKIVFVAFVLLAGVSVGFGASIDLDTSVGLNFCEQGCLDNGVTHSCRANWAKCNEQVKAEEQRCLNNCKAKYGK